MANEKEDYNLIRRLQGELGVSIYYNRKIKTLRVLMGLGLLNEKELQSLASEKEDYNLIRRLQGELGVSIYYNRKNQNTESTDGTGSFK